MRRSDSAPLPPEVAADLEALDLALRGERPDPLVELFEAERTPPRPEWARELDARVAAGFPPPARPRKRRRLPSLSGPLLPALGAVACLLVGVVVFASLRGGEDPSTSSSSSVQSEGGAGASSAPAPERGAEPESAVPSSTAAPSSSAPAPFRGRAVERTTDLELTVPAKRMQSAAQRVYRVAGGLGGIVDRASVSSSTSSGNAYFELRFPTARADQGVARLAELGKVTRQTSGTVDITGLVASARERLAAARAERKGILRALGRASTPTAIDALKRRLAIADDAVRRIRAEQRRLGRRTSYSRVSLSLQAPGKRSELVPGGDGTWTPGDALKDAGRILAVCLGVGVIAVALAIPLGLLGGLGWAGSSLLRRRRREAALDG